MTVRNTIKKVGAYIFVVVFTISLTFGLAACGGEAPSTKANQVQTEKEQVESKADFKKSCKKVSFESMLRNPSKYDRVKFSCVVADDVTTDSQSERRVYIVANKKSYDSHMTMAAWNMSYAWSEGEIAHVIIESKKRYLSGDVLTVYGELHDIATQNVAGDSEYEVDVPQVYAKYVKRAKG